MEDYEKLWQLGAGGQGKVHKVRHRKTHKLYALKQILCKDSHEMNFALHEIKVLTNVKHDNIIGFRDFFIHKDRHMQQYSICLSMELCECGDFSDRIKDARRKKVKFEESRIRKWIVQMCAAMNYLHEQDYIHRDIKPTNVFFTADDNVRLGDFGLSRRCEEAGRRTVVGTPYYFAPELLLRQRYTNKVDLWGLGVVLLELCTLKERPINSQVLQSERILADVEKEFTNKGYSLKLAQLCSSLMAKDPRNRPSAREVLVKFATDAEKERYQLNAPRPRSKSGGPNVLGAKANEHHEQREAELQKKLATRDDEVRKLKEELQKLKEAKEPRAPLQQLHANRTGSAGKRVVATKTPIVVGGQAANARKNFMPINADGKRVRPGESIQQAIDAASDGDVISVDYGVYHRPLTISKNITLTATDSEKRPVIEVDDKTVLTVSSTCTLTYLVLKQRKAEGERKWVAVDFRSGSPKMHHCDLSSYGGACVTVHKTAEPHIHDCDIHDGAQAGVYLFDGAKGILENCDIYNNTYAAVLLKRGAQPIVRNNKIREGKDTGVFICHDSKGTIQSNEIFDNGGSGVVVKARGSPLIANNHIHSNKQAGVFLCDRGGGIVRDNDISCNIKAGVLIKTHANPLIQGNTIKNGKETGVYCFENGNGVVRENKIIGNQNAGVLVTSGGHLTIERNTIQGNKYEGVWVCNNGEAVITGNDLKGNTKV